MVDHRNKTETAMAEWGQAVSGMWRICAGQPGEQNLRDPGNGELTLVTIALDKDPSDLMAAVLQLGESAAAAADCNADGPNMGGEAHAQALKLAPVLRDIVLQRSRFLRHSTTSNWALPLAAGHEAEAAAGLLAQTTSKAARQTGGQRYR